MTKDQLKTQIDTDITNKTSAKSITPTNVGKNMKDVVDFIPDITSKENISNKSINIVTDATSDIKYPSVKAVNDGLTLKVDKVTGKSLVLDTEITKLSHLNDTTDMQKPVSTAQQAALDNLETLLQSDIQAQLVDSTLINGVTTSSSVPPTGNIHAIGVGPGTYTNWGGMVIPNDNIGTLQRVSGVYSVSLTPISIPDGIVSWTATTFTSNKQVNHLGKIWQSNAATLSTDVPGTSGKWDEILTGYAASEEVETLSNSDYQLFDKNEVEVNKSIIGGVIVAYGGYFVSDYIPYVKANGLFIINKTLAYYDTLDLLFYDTDKLNPISKTGVSCNPINFTPLTDVYSTGYVRFSGLITGIDNWFAGVSREVIEPSLILKRYGLRADSDDLLETIQSKNLLQDRYSVTAFNPVLYDELRPDLNVNEDVQSNYVQAVTDSFVKDLGLVNWFVFPANAGPQYIYYPNNYFHRVQFSYNLSYPILKDYIVGCIVKCGRTKAQVESEFSITANDDAQVKKTVVELSTGVFLVQQYFFYYTGTTQDFVFTFQTSDHSYDISIGGFILETANGQYQKQTLDLYKSGTGYRVIDNEINNLRIDTLSKTDSIVNNNSGFFNKNIVVNGMSITASGKYVDNACKKIGAICKNTAYSGAFVTRSRDGVFGLSCSLTDSSTRSYEKLLLGLNAVGDPDFDYNDVDLFIIDMGVNDFGTTVYVGSENAVTVDMSDPYNRDSTTHPYTGGMNYIIKNIYRRKPNARIALINHYENVFRNGAWFANNAVASFWNIPILNDATFLGMNLRPIFDDVNAPDILSYYCSDAVKLDRLHPFANSMELMRKRDFIVSDWLKSIA